MKMAEDTKLKNEDHLWQGPDNNPETQSQQFLQSQISKESLYQQRQKCELRRLLKHTHPELKMLDEVIDEELAEVLRSEAELTAEETGYEGEVRSRRQIFENSSHSGNVSFYAPKMNTSEKSVETGNVGKTSAFFEHPDKKPCLDQTVASSPDPNRECEEDIKRKDVQATRRIFESQCVDTSQSSPENIQGKVFTGLVQNEERDECDQQKEKVSLMNWTEESPKEPCDSGHGTGKQDDELHSPELHDSMKTRASLLQNNPFISKNIEHSYAHMTKPKMTAQDEFAANVKDRAHLFESMPFDKIRHQNKDEVETMVEPLKESLTSLYHFNVIHADGSIIEVNETMRAKKAKYIKTANGAEINYDEVSEGNFQNFILRVLPRANLKPRVTYLTEVCDGGIQSTLVNVPMHPHQFTGTQDTECNTANVVQLVEDILNQDNSLRKGVIIQEAADKSADIVVYSLYKYSDKEDVRRYCPQEYSMGTEGRKSPLISPDGACQRSVIPEATIKGNVKHFKSCIEKGELEYLKTLQDKSTVEGPEVPLQQMLEQCTDFDPKQRANIADEGTPDWAPVDIKRLRNMFSEDQTQSQSHQIVNKDLSHSNTSSMSFPGQNVTLEKAHSYPVNDVDIHTERCNEDKLVERDRQILKEPMDSITHVQFETQCGDHVVQAESIETVNEDDELSRLHESTIEVGNLQQIRPEKQESKSVQSTKQPVSAAPDTKPEVIHHKPNVSPQSISEEMGLRVNSAPDIEHETKDHEQSATEETHIATSSKTKKITEEAPMQHFQATAVSPDVSETQQEEEELVLQGKLKAALDSLERSNVNITKGDFKAAMIYRNSSKPPKDRLKNATEISSKRAINQDVCVTASQTQASPNKVTEEGTTTGNEKSISTAPQKIRRPVGPKPAIPPKPEHLKVKMQNNQSTKNEKDIDSTEIDKQSQDSSKINTGKESEHAMLGEGSEKRVEISEKYDKDDQQGEEKDTIQEKVAKDNLFEEQNETEEAHINFSEACKKFGGRNDHPKKRPPVKPKRVKMGQPDNKMSSIPSRMDAEPQTVLHNHPCGQEQKDTKELQQEGKVELRAKKGRTETEVERLQRLSVHMDEIMRGNMGTALEIFDNLRKQEELRGILSRVEEIEADTSNVDVRSLRKVFENVPDWVVSSNENKPKRAIAERKRETTNLAPESKSSMAHVFGDLERASEEIMTLKEQTLARLLDIEEAIKKALYSVSTLKSESDIAGLSCLFKESLGSVQGSGSISKISIGSSKTLNEGPTASPDVHNASTEITPKHREGPPCSPAFISIQSAARKSVKPDLVAQETRICPTCLHNPEKFRSTKLLQCNTPGTKEPTGSFPQREISVLEIQTGRES